MDKWINNGLWLIGGIALGGIAVSEYVENFVEFYVSAYILPVIKPEVSVDVKPEVSVGVTPKVATNTCLEIIRYDNRHFNKFSFYDEIIVEYREQDSGGVKVVIGYTIADGGIPLPFESYCYFNADGSLSSYKTDSA